MKKQVIKTESAPAAIGPYSQAVRSGNLIFTSGQLPLDPVTGEINGDINAQTRRVLNNLEAVLKAAGATFNDVVKTTVFLTDMNDFAAMNEIYRQYFDHEPPARSTAEVSRLARGALVEIEAVAVIPAATAPLAKASTRE